MKIKINLLVLVFLMGLSYSCSNDHDEILSSNIDNEKLYSVKLSMNNLTVETGSMQRSTEGEPINFQDYNNLAYSVAKYYPDNNEWRVVDSNMYFRLEGEDISEIPASLDLKLSKGTYRISIGVAMKKIYSASVVNPEINQAALITPNMTDSEVYQGTTEIEIVNSDIITSMTVKRAVGKIQLAIDGLNELPEDVKSVVPVLIKRYKVDAKTRHLYLRPEGFYVDGSGSRYRTINTEGLKLYNYYNTIAAKRSEYITISKINPFTFYLSPNDKVLDLKPEGESVTDVTYDLYLQGSKTEKIYAFTMQREDLEAFSDENTAFMKCLVKDIKIEANKQIIINGNIASTSNSGFQVYLAPEWDADVQEIETEAKM